MSSGKRKKSEQVRGGGWPEVFRTRARLVREAAGLTQRQMGERLGMSSGNSIAKIETGTLDLVRLDYLALLVELAQQADISPAWALAATDVGGPAALSTANHDHAASEALSAIRKILRGLHAEQDLDDAIGTRRVAELIEPGFEIIDAEQLPREWRGGYVPVIGRLAAGEGVDTLEAESHPPGWAWRFLKYAGAPAGAFAVRVEGDSMAPDYRDGDIVIVDGGTRVVSGVCCTITRTNGDRVARLKRLVLRGRFAELHSLNRDYETIRVEAASVEAYAIWRHLPLVRRKTT